MLFFNRKDQPLLTVSSAEQQDVIARLIAATTLRKGYYLLLVLAVLIVSAGLLMNNAAVIIGGMVIAPLLLPILALSLSLVGRSLHGIAHALSVLFFSVALTVILAYAVTWIAAFTHVQIAWIPDHVSPLLYLTVAFCSGIIAAFAWVKEDIAPTIAGIAIAVSLLPPLCAVGIAAALQDLHLAGISMLIFGLNVVGILLAALLAFILLGFLRTGRVTEAAVKEVKKK